MDQKKASELADIYQEVQPSILERYYLIIKLGIPSIVCLIVVQG